MKRYVNLIFLSLIVIVAIVIIFSILTTRIRMNYTEKVYSIEVLIPGVRGIRTQDKKIIKEAITEVNKIRYCKYFVPEIYNSSPDGIIAIYDKDRKKIEVIRLYGYVAVYDNKRYAVLPFTYSKLEKLCRKFYDR